MKAEMGSGVTDVIIINLSAGWGWVINTMPWPFYPWKGFPVPIVRESGWTSGPVWTVVEKRKFLASTGVQTPNCPAHSKLLLTLYTLKNILIASVIASHLQISAPYKISKLSELIHVYILLFSVTAISCIIVLYLSAKNMTIRGNKRSQYKYSIINEEYCNWC
jgi:hypothetical protein